MAGTLSRLGQCRQSKIKRAVPNESAIVALPAAGAPYIAKSAEVLKASKSNSSPLAESGLCTTLGRLPDSQANLPSQVTRDGHVPVDLFPIRKWHKKKFKRRLVAPTRRKPQFRRELRLFLWPKIVIDGKPLFFRLGRLRFESFPFLHGGRSFLIVFKTGGEVGRREVACAFCPLLGR